jgi:hypothetical protein
VVGQSELMVMEESDIVFRCVVAYSASSFSPIQFAEYANAEEIVAETVAAEMIGWEWLMEARQRRK